MLELLALAALLVEPRLDGRELLLEPLPAGVILLAGGPPLGLELLELGLQCLLLGLARLVGVGELALELGVLGLGVLQRRFLFAPVALGGLELLRQRLGVRLRALERLAQPLALGAGVLDLLLGRAPRRPDGLLGLGPGAPRLLALCLELLAQAGELTLELGLGGLLALLALGRLRLDMLGLGTRVGQDALCLLGRLAPCLLDRVALDLLRVGRPSTPRVDRHHLGAPRRSGVLHRRVPALHQSLGGHRGQTPGEHPGIESGLAQDERGAGRPALIGAVEKVALVAMELTQRAAQLVDRDVHAAFERTLPMLTRGAHVQPRRALPRQPPGLLVFDPRDQRLLDDLIEIGLGQPHQRAGAQHRHGGVAQPPRDQRLFTEAFPLAELGELDLGALGATATRHHGTAGLDDVEIVRLAPFAHDHVPRPHLDRLHGRDHSLDRHGGQPCERARSEEPAEPIGVVVAVDLGDLVVAALVRGEDLEQVGVEAKQADLGLGPRRDRTRASGRERAARVLAAAAHRPHDLIVPQQRDLAADDEDAVVIALAALEDQPPGGHHLDRRLAGELPELRWRELVQRREGPQQLLVRRLVGSHRLPGLAGRVAGRRRQAGESDLRRGRLGRP